MRHLRGNVRVVGLSRMPPSTFRTSLRGPWGSISPRWSVGLVGLSDNALALTSPLKTSRQLAALLQSCWRRHPHRSVCVVPGVRRAGSPLMGFCKDPPLCRHPRCASTPGLPRLPRVRPSEEGRPRCVRLMASLRHLPATAGARSALAVSHGFDGLLRASLCRSIAPCSRLWGSPGFELQWSECLLRPLSFRSSSFLSLGPSAVRCIR